MEDVRTKAIGLNQRMHFNWGQIVNRAEWKKIYRISRIARRENHKAMTDMLIYGTGIIEKLDYDPYFRHIPFIDYVKQKEEQNEAP